MAGWVMVSARERGEPDLGLALADGGETTEHGDNVD
jgi:hypothetical protein